MKGKINFKNISLRLFLVSIVLPLLLLFLILSWHDTRRFFSFTQEIYSGALETSAGTLSASFSELESISFTPYLYKEVSQAMLYMYDGFLLPGQTPPSYLNVDELQNSYILLMTKLLHTARQKVVSISFYPFSAGYGSCFTIHRNSAGLSWEAVDTTFVQSLYEKTIPYGSRTLFLSLDSSTSSPNTFSLLRTIKDYDSGKDLGILRIDTEVDTLIPALDTVPLAQDGYITLTDQSGVAIYQKGIASTDRRYAIQTCAVGDSGWTITLGTPSNAFRISNQVSILMIFLVTLFAYLASVVVYRIRSAGTVRSVDEILLAIQQLQQGNLQYPCRVREDSELKSIADALNETGKKLDNLIHTEAEARAARFRAEYLALQSQINPHFLSNILNGFVALNRMGERQLLEKSILHLTKLFRYICSNCDTATVEQEANFVIQYLELQKLRYEDQIHYKISLSPEAALVQIPKLIVQPLVENSIVHGMRDDDAGIQITFSASVLQNESGSYLELCIDDDGTGFDTTHSNGRVGLDNVAKRLAFFEDAARLEIRSTYGEGTTVKLHIPLSAQHT